MNDPNRLSKLRAEISSLMEQQCDSSADATFLGWADETRAAHELRSARLAHLSALQDELQRYRQQNRVVSKSLRGNRRASGALT
jgi:hypothetical protein